MENVLFSEQARLLDEAKARLVLTSDYQLANALGWPQTMLSAYRHRRRSMAPAQILQFHELTKIDLRRILVAVVADQQRAENQTSGKAA